ncbi:hypothetical protein [Ochrobactrum sp. MYb379]|uniref:hypothetical protein n=1 Tax=Ochrobactrum sp. MYb379 TaxID=2745275 RepID=UPI0030A6961F
MPFPITPLVGTKPGEKNDSASKFKVGTTFRADDGHLYVYARASAAIAASTVSVLTEPAFTMAGGAGDWTSPAFALANGDEAWFKKTAI